MSKILFITSRNMLTTSGELRLIKNRAETLFHQYDISTDFIAVAKQSRIQSKKRETINAGGNTTTIAIAQKNPISVMTVFFRLKKELKNKLQQNGYDTVVLSGVGTHFLAGYIKKKYPTVRLMVDCHGASETSSVMAPKSKRIEHMWFTAISKLDYLGLKYGFRYFDAAFAVSEALKKYMTDRYVRERKIPFYIVPCATTSSIMPVEYRELYRKEYREKYNIQPNEIVFVYSGGVSSWQCIDETIELYCQIAKTMNQKVRMLMFSHQIGYIQEKTRGIETIQTDSYQPQELEKALCAGDYAFLLRKESIVNRVAFPNKFLEYVNSGMSIITTPHVDAVAKSVKDNGLGYIYDFGDNIGQLVTYVKEHGQQRNDDNVIIETINRYSFVNTLKVFANDVNPKK